MKQGPLDNIVPPFGDGIFPPAGIVAIADLSNGQRVMGRMVHLSPLSPEGYHCVVFVPAQNHEIYRVIFVGAVPEWLGGRYATNALVVRAWEEFLVL